MIHIAFLAIARAAALHLQHEPLQRAALAHSIDASPIPASERQARAILEYVHSHDD